LKLHILPYYLEKYTIPEDYTKVEKILNKHISEKRDYSNFSWKFLNDKGVPKPLGSTQGDFDKVLEENK